MDIYRYDMFVHKIRRCKMMILVHINLSFILYIISVFIIININIINNK